MTCGTGGYWSGNCGGLGYGGLGYGGYGGWGLGGLGYGGWGLGGCGLGGCGFGGLGYGGWGLGGCGFGGLGYGLGLGCGLGGFGYQNYPYYAGSLPCFNQCFPFWGSNCGIFAGYQNCFWPQLAFSGSYFPWYNQYSSSYTPRRYKSY